MKIASWNVNSLKVRLPHVLAWAETAQPDILGLQEIKLIDDAFPMEALREGGFEAVCAGQKTYNGVALLTREPARDVVRDIPGFEDDQRRVVAATVGEIRVINLYCPNGKAVGTDKYEYKLRWFAALREWLADELSRFERLVVMGDFNVAPEDRDVHDPVAWEGKILCSAPEREAFQALLDLGLADSFRLFDQPDNSFSWWDYRAAAFRRNLGLRIDHILVSPALATQARAASVDVTPRRWERPSDHAPAVLELDG